MRHNDPDGEHIERGQKEISPEERRWRRLAIQIAIQLPDNEIDALTILDLTRELIKGYMEGRAPESATVIPLRGVQKST